MQAQLFSDDFTRDTDPGPLTPWTTNAGSGNWTVTGGVMVGGPNTSSSYGYAYITNPFTNFYVQAQFQFPAGAYGGGLGGRLNTSSGAHYAVWVFPENGSGSTPVVRLLRFNSYSSFEVLQSKNLAAVGTTTHTLGLECSGSQINAYFDSTKVLSATDATYASGSISLDSWTDTTGYQMTVDNVLVLRDAPPSGGITVNGGHTYQVIDGFGVNVNHRSWTNNELEPVLDALIDQAGMTLFRVVYDNSDWETSNDNSDANVMNWDYYRTAYTSAEFQALWGIMAYLNQKGITNGLMPNFQGFGPSWMGGLSLNSGSENEWAEMIASALVYARYTNHLQFTVVGPGNEPDSSTGVGIHTTSSQYPVMLHDLSQQLDTNGLGDVRLVGPDLADTSATWLSAMMADPVVMAKLAAFGVHGYQGTTAGSTDVDKFLQQSAYPDLHFWMTEFNVWCQVCQTGGHGTNNWDYFRGSAAYLLEHLANGASAGTLWEGYDSVYRNNDDNGLHWSFWGLFAVDDTNASPRTYTARKNFYTVAQITAFVRPGAQQIDVSGVDAPLTMLAFYNTNNGQFTLTGLNTGNSETTLAGTLTSLPTIPSLDLYYTSSTTNLCYGGSVNVTNGIFSAVVPADCVFTLTYTNRALDLSPVAVAPMDAGQTVTITNNASGPDSPPQSLSFTLLAAPEGATMDTNTGVFTWRAPVAYANTTNPVVLAATDDGAPPVSATQSFDLVVNPLAQPTLQTPAVSNGLLTATITGPIGPDYLLERSSNLTSWSTIFTTTPFASPFDLTDTNTPLYPATFYRIRLSP